MMIVFGVVILLSFFTVLILKWRQSSPNVTPVFDNVDKNGVKEQEFITGNAAVEGVKIVILESFPIQVRAEVTGYFPDACTNLIETKKSFQNQTFEIEMITNRPKEAICSQAIIPFSEVIPLDVFGLKKGKYTVIVNGVMAEFEITADNQFYGSEGTDSK